MENYNHEIYLSNIINNRNEEGLCANCVLTELCELHLMDMPGLVRRRQSWE